MLSFEIKIGNKKLIVKPLEMEQYELYYGDRLISTLSANLSENGLEWKSNGLSPIKTKIIGKLIENRL